RLRGVVGRYRSWGNPAARQWLREMQHDPMPADLVAYTDRMERITEVQPENGEVCYMLGSFFFQAEDGIRDFHVTGVQTCALPIWRMPPEKCFNGRFAASVKPNSSNSSSVFRRASFRLSPSSLENIIKFSAALSDSRSEERRVGKECRSRGWRYRHR